MPVQHGMDGADRRAPQVRIAPAQPLANLGGAPARKFMLEAHDPLLNDRRQAIGVPVGTTAPIGEPVGAAIPIAAIDFVASLARDAELLAERCHRLPVEQAGDEPETFVHDVTLLPRHAPSLSRGQVSPMSPE
jgi:hypothetical protein